MAANFDELERILKRAQGMSAEQLVGFLSEQGFMTITTPNYDPWCKSSDAEKLEWHVFGLFLVRLGGEARGVEAHVEYLLQKQFKSVTEWLGEEGAKWRKACGMRQMPKQLLADWAAFLAEQRGRGLADIKKEFDALERQQQSAPAPKRLITAPPLPKAAAFFQSQTRTRR